MAWAGQKQNQTLGSGSKKHGGTLAPTAPASLPCVRTGSFTAAATRAMAALPFFGSSSSAGPSSSAAVPSAAAGPDMLQLFVRAREPKKPCRCIRCPSTTTVSQFWEQWVAPAYCGGGPPPRGLRLMCAGRTLAPDSVQGLAAAGVQHLATVEVAGRLPSQGFARMHQLLEKLVETLAPAGSTGSGNSPSGDDNDASLPTASREPIMHAIDAEINEHRAEARRHVPPGTPVSPCHCMACTLRPNSALRLCGTLLHSNDVAIINLAFRVVQFVLRARADCCTPVVLFSETSGALVLCGGDAYRRAARCLPGAVRAGLVGEADQSRAGGWGQALASRSGRRPPALPCFSSPPVSCVLRALAPRTPCARSYLHIHPCSLQPPLPSLLP